jgi:hypothetical protein
MNPQVGTPHARILDEATNSHFARIKGDSTRGFFVSGRRYVRIMSEGSLLEAITEMRAAYDKVTACSADGLTHPGVLAVLSELETLTRQLPTQSHRLLARLQREASPVELGAKSLRDVLKIRLRIAGPRRHGASTKPPTSDPAPH